MCAGLPTHSQVDLPTEAANFDGQRSPRERVTEIAGNALQRDIIRALVRVSFQPLEKNQFVAASIRRASPIASLIASTDGRKSPAISRSNS